METGEELWICLWVWMMIFYMLNIVQTIQTFQRCKLNDLMGTCIKQDTSLLLRCWSPNHCYSVFLEKLCLMSFTRCWNFIMPCPSEQQICLMGQINWRFTMELKTVSPMQKSLNVWWTLVPQFEQLCVRPAVIWRSLSKTRRWNWSSCYRHNKKRCGNSWTSSAMLFNLQCSWFNF